MPRKKNTKNTQPRPPPPPPPRTTSPPPSANPHAGTWFHSFPPFIYDPSAGLRENFERLADQRHWGPKLRRKRWTQCQEEEFGHAFGTDTGKLAAWQGLCCEVGVGEVPGSIAGCRKVLGSRQVLVNLVNLIDHRNVGTEVIRFKSFAEFRKYTWPDNVFPKKRAKEEGFIRALLRKL